MDSPTLSPAKQQVVADLRLGEAQVRRAGCSASSEAEWQLRQWFTKICAPRCSEGLSCRFTGAWSSGTLAPAAIARAGARAGTRSEKCEDHLHHQVTRCGSGFSLSFAVYQGISRKKRK